MAGPLDPFDPTRPQLPDNSGELPATLRAIKEVLVDYRDRIEALEAQVAANLGKTTGIIYPYGGPATTPPEGFLFCFGQEVSREDFAELFSVIGTIWGVGDGTTTFNVPDMRGRVFRGHHQGTGRDHDASRQIGSYQEDTLQEFSASFDVESAARSRRLPSNPEGGVGLTDAAVNPAWHVMTQDVMVPTPRRKVTINPATNNAARTSNETVSKNAAGLFIIKT